MTINFAAPTAGEIHYPIAAAADVCVRNATTITVDSCQHSEPFIPALVRESLLSAHIYLNMSMSLQALQLLQTL